MTSIASVADRGGNDSDFSVDEAQLEFCGDELGDSRVKGELKQENGSSEVEMEVDETTSTSGSSQKISFLRRVPEESREIRFSFGLITRADGSAECCIGHTVSIVKVIGPYRIRKRQDVEASHRQMRLSLHCDWFVKTSRNRRDLPSHKHQLNKLLRSLISQAVILNDFRNKKLEVCLRTLADDGSAWATATNAMSMALLDSGVEMRFPFVAVSASLFSNKQIVPFPNAFCERLGSTQFHFVFKFEPEDAISSPIFTLQDGQPFTEEDWDRVLEVAVIEAKRVMAALKSKMADHVSSAAWA